MPAGLDGYHDPIVTPEREQVLDKIADLVCAHAGPRTLVGIDGRPGVGKSSFADELAARLAAQGVAAVRSWTDAERAGTRGGARTMIPSLASS